MKKRTKKIIGWSIAATVALGLGIAAGPTVGNAQDRQVRNSNHNVCTWAGKCK